VYALRAKFRLDWFILSTSVGENPPIVAVFWTSAFSGVVNWQQTGKVEHGCTTTNLPLSKGFKIVFVLQRLHGEIGRTNSEVQKPDGRTNRQRDRQKLSVLGVKSEPHQTSHVDRGPQARSCTSKTWEHDAQFRR